MADFICAAAETRQLLEDVQANLHDAIAGEAILKSYTEETRERFVIMIAQIMEAQPGRALHGEALRALAARARRGVRGQQGGRVVQVDDLWSRSAPQHIRATTC